ncbi:hypothetical protein ACIP98_27490 [Streptomyces sp. NPDC088354]|uniref:hypothetical protein n=1 Tax=Streptomyces sp. NPDC088354 TaxID=3365856 RepID=UPI00382CB98A
MTHASDVAPAAVTQAELRRTVASLLPAGDISWETAPVASGRGRNPSASPVVTLRFDDGKGAARLIVGLDRLPAPRPTGTFDCPDRAHHPYGTCAVRRLDNGARLVLTQDRSGLGSYGVEMRDASLVTADESGRVRIHELNAAPGAGDVPTRRHPPLDLDRLAALASSSVWEPLLERLPRPAGLAASPSEPVRTRRDILAVLLKHLPAGVRALWTAGAEKGYAEALLDDGHGQALIDVTVQKWAGDQGALTPIFANARREADGTRIATRRFTPAGGGENCVEWDTDIITADGLRVVVSQLNAPAYGLPANRKTSPLSPRDSLRIAIDPEFTGDR